MRKRLSELLVAEAKKDPKFIVLSGDHGYGLFDQLRKKSASQFINCGVAEQNMVGVAAGLARQGFRVVVYGLAAFVPMRVLEQIKLDICYSNLSVIFIGDGAGLVYSTLGASHQCAEDIAALSPLPNINIYSPCDADELENCLEEALDSDGVAYIRIGKCDRPEAKLKWDSENKRICLVATGSLCYPASQASRKYNINFLSVPRIKPSSVVDLVFLNQFKHLIVLEEHSKYGGLASILREKLPNQKITSIALKDQFSNKCGSWEYAMSEHELDDKSVMRRIGEILGKEA